MSYRDKFYKKYVSSHAATIHGGQNISIIEGQFSTWKSYFIKFLPKDKNAAILDVGCGDGGFVLWLNSMGYKNVQGIDYSAEQIEVAKSYGVNNVHQADALIYLPENPDKFDLVFSSDVLEHIPKENVLEFVACIRISLKPCGFFVAQTVNAESLMWGRLRHGDFTHEGAFTQTSIRQVFSLAGYDEIRVFPQRPIVHGLKSLVRYCIWRMFELFFHFYLAVLTGGSAGIFTQNLIAVAKK